MTKYYFLVFFAIRFLTFGQIKTPSQSPTAQISQNIGLANLSFSYSRPLLKDRKIFGNLVPFNKVWRTGANKCTTFSIDQEIEINGRSIKPGTYALFTIPKEKTWTVILNSDTKQWGAYDYDEKKDLLRFEVPALKTPNKVEQFTISINSLSTTSATVILAWENTQIPIFMEQCVDDLIMAEIKTKTSEPNAKTITFEQAAEYYNDNNINLQQALLWAQKVLVEEKKYWNYSLVAQIASKLNNCEMAVENAKISLELALKEKDDAYVLLNKNVLNKCAGSIKK